MTNLLQHLIAEARGLANDHPCTREHVWVSVGGNDCQYCGSENDVCECARCGECDYGELEPSACVCDRAKAAGRDEK